MRLQPILCLRGNRPGQRHRGEQTYCCCSHQTGPSEYQGDARVEFPTRTEIDLPQQPKAGDHLEARPQADGDRP